MDGRSEFWTYLGSATATIVVLFGAQLWYASYLDVAVVHGQGPDVAKSTEVAKIRAQEEQKLAKIGEAMDALAKRGRGSFPAIAAKPSEDLSAMSGWIFEPGFAPYVPRPKAAPEPAPAAAVEAGVAPEGEGAAPEAGEAARVEAAVEVVRQTGTGGLGVTKPATKPATKPVVAKPAPAPAAAPSAPQAPAPGH
jgi:hypothetical protein